MTTFSGTIKSGGSAIAASYFPADWTMVSVEYDLSGDSWAVAATAAVQSDASFSVDSLDAMEREVRLLACQPLGRPWESGLSVSAGDYVHKSTGLDGVVFRAAGAGTTGGSEPAWDTTHGNTTSDNGITWTAVEYLSMSDDQGPHIYLNYGAYNFTLELLHASGQAGLRTNIQDISTLWEDTSATVQATVGNPVRRVDDVSGNDNHLTVAQNNAILRQDGNSKYYLEFPSGSPTWFSLATPLDDARSALVAYDDDGSPDYAPFLGDSDDADFHGTTDTAILSASFGTTSNAVNGDWRSNGAVIDPTATGTTPTSLAIITARTAGDTSVGLINKDRSQSGRYFVGKLYELIVSNEVWSDTITADTESAVNDAISGPM